MTVPLATEALPSAVKPQHAALLRISRPTSDERDEYLRLRIEVVSVGATEPKRRDSIISAAGAAQNTELREGRGSDTPDCRLSLRQHTAMLMNITRAARSICCVVCGFEAASSVSVGAEWESDKDSEEGARAATVGAAMGERRWKGEAKEGGDG